MLRDRLADVGATLFRLRNGIPPLALLAVPIAILRAAPDRPGSAAIAWLGLSCALGGLAFRFLVIGFVPRGTSGRIRHRQKARRLNTSGAYSIVRNPLYVGNFLCWTGCTLLLRDPLLIASITALFLAFYYPIILSEERFLLEKFGDEYRAFAARVPRLIVDPRLWRAPDLPFSLRIALRREHDTIFGTLTAVVVLQVAWQGLVPTAGPIDVFWIALFVAALVFWLGLKSTRKLTTWFDRPHRRDDPRAAARPEPKTAR